MAATLYSSAEEVIAYTGVRAADFKLVADTGGSGLTADEKLYAIINVWLAQAKDLIDTDRCRDYASESSEVPAGINNIAMRICANMVAQAVIRRETPIIRVGEYAVKFNDDAIFTRAIQTDLARYPKKANFRMAIHKDLTEETDTDVVVSNYV